MAIDKLEIPSNLYPELQATNLALLENLQFIIDDFGDPNRSVAMPAIINKEIRTLSEFFLTDDDYDNAMLGNFDRIFGMLGYIRKEISKLEEEQVDVIKVLNKYCNVLAPSLNIQIQSTEEIEPVLQNIMGQILNNPQSNIYDNENMEEVIKLTKSHDFLFAFGSLRMSTMTRDLIKKHLKIEELLSGFMSLFT